MTDDAEDELADAEIGETVTVERRQRHYSINSAPSVFYGRGREADAEIAEINRIETDDGFDDWEVVYRGEITRTGPPFDPDSETRQRSDDAGDSKGRAARDSKGRAARLADWASIAIGTAVAGVVGWIVLHGPASEIAETPQPELTGPSLHVLDFAGLAIMAVLVILSLKYAPGMVGGRR